MVKNLEMSTCKLSEAPSNQKFKILGFELENSIKHKLYTMGIHFNDDYIKQNNASWGPVLIQNLSNHATRIALGRNLANKIFVECE